MYSGLHKEGLREGAPRAIHHDLARSSIVSVSISYHIRCSSSMYTLHTYNVIIYTYAFISTLILYDMYVYQFYIHLHYISYNVSIYMYSNIIHVISHKL